MIDSDLWSGVLGALLALWTMGLLHRNIVGLRAYRRKVKELTEENRFLREQRDLAWADQKRLTAQRDEAMRRAREAHDDLANVGGFGQTVLRARRRAREVKPDLAELFPPPVMKDTAFVWRSDIDGGLPVPVMKDPPDRSWLTEGDEVSWSDDPVQRHRTYLIKQRFRDMLGPRTYPPPADLEYEQVKLPQLGVPEEDWPTIDGEPRVAKLPFADGSPTAEGTDAVEALPHAVWCPEHPGFRWYWLTPPDTWVLPKEGETCPHPSHSE